MHRLRRLGRLGFVLLLALYPAAVYWSLQEGRIVWAAGVLAATALLQAVGNNNRLSLFCALAAAALAALAALCDTSFPVKFYPVAANLAWLAFFGFSLTGESVVEKLARLREPDLPPRACRYCRRVTLAWCGFFIANGAAALDSAVNRSDAWWALYNGLIAYGLMGVMFMGEWMVRRYVRKRNRL